jgi:hypothetical protein
MALMKTISLGSTRKFRTRISLGAGVIACLFISFPSLSQEAQGYRVKGSGETVNLRERKDKPPEPVALPAPGLSVSAPGPAPAATPAPLRPTLSPEEAFRLANQPQPQFVNHEVLAVVLRKYVTKSGWVDYRALQRDKEAQEDLRLYIEDLSALNPSSLSDPRDRLAAWLNLYDAVVIADILKHYPVNSLLKIKDWFAAKRFKVGGKEYSLMEVEEEIFRKELNDPRTVLARVNGGSSASRMLREPFLAGKVDEQLDERVLTFLRDPANVRYDPKRGVLTLSALFLWYQQDFPDLAAFLQAYLDRMPERFWWEFSGFDFQLNDAKLH